MKTNHSSESGIFNPRIFVGFGLFAISALLAIVSLASDPATSTITVPTQPNQVVSVTWTGEIPAGVDGKSDCSAIADTPLVDQHLPTIVVPAGVYITNPHTKFKFRIEWDGSSGNDEILTVLKPNGAELASSDGGDPHEEVDAENLDPGEYKVVVCGFISGPGPQSYTGTLTIDTTPLAPAPPLPAPTPAVPGVPRYYNYAPPPAMGEASGEPSIGYNPVTHNAMYIAGLQTLRVSFPEEAPGVLGSCPANWQDVSYIWTKTKSLDPILFTDQRTGRTFVSQLDSIVPPASPVLIGLNSFMAYSDDDGATWTPAQINPPDASYDHQTVGAGPYPASLSVLANDVNKGDAVYYCAQAGVTAFCSRSDDGGLTFGRAMTIYNSQTDGCGGIHGHVKVAPDGTVYVPNRGCNSVQSIAVSEDAGTTWTVRNVQGPLDSNGNPTWVANAPPGILDPTIASASDGTIYFAWIDGQANGDGHAMAAVSHDKGVTWENPKDLGLIAPASNPEQNIHNAVFVEAVAGDPNRAAVGFIGTTQTGDHASENFNGIWYAFIATTYDGGQTWTTVNATPNAPVQREGGICNSGTGCTGHNRNLLDFTEITMDEKGRVLYAYADGCVDECELHGPNSFSSKATIARQAGGKGLLAQFDSDFAEPIAPRAACLSGRRDDMASYLKWTTPDNGGSDISSYKIYRSVTGVPGTETQIGYQVGNRYTYNDRSVDPSVASYSYRIVAVNAQGDGAASNIVDLSVQPRLEATGACNSPGIELLTDPVGDNTDQNVQHDITSVSIAEPVSNADTGAADKIYFTLKVKDLTAPIQPGWRFSVRFNVPGYYPPDHPVIGPQEDWHVSMVTSDGADPDFTYGTTGVFQGASRFFVTLGKLDAASAVSADGTITLVLPKEALRSSAFCSGGDCAPLAAGQAINVTLASVRATAPSDVPGTGGTNETIPDTTGAAAYALRGDNLCLPNTAPTANLSVNPTSGNVPLTVTLDGSASFDPDAATIHDTIASYTFNFGDGSDDVTQTSPTLSHTFSNIGMYPVKLVVTDSRGKVSQNTDMKMVEVKPQPTPTPTPTPTPGPTVNVSASPTAIREGQTATYTITLSNATNVPITVNYGMSGKAILGSDYTLSGSPAQVTIPAGQTSANVTLSAIVDNVKEKSETAIMTLQSGNGYNLPASTGGKKKKKAGSAPSATVTISD
jgi:PKD repeat protein